MQEKGINNDQDKILCDFNSQRERDYVAVVGEETIKYFLYYVDVHNEHY